MKDPASAAGPFLLLIRKSHRAGECPQFEGAERRRHTGTLNSQRYPAAGGGPPWIESGSVKLFSEEVMEQLSNLIGPRRNEDIALDMMKFIAATTGYGKIGTPGAGFQGGTVNK